MASLKAVSLAVWRVYKMVVAMAVSKVGLRVVLKGQMMVVLRADG